MFRIRHKAHDTKAISSDVAEECESFLSGGYLDRLNDRSVEIPAWAWINLVAHAAPARVEELSMAALGPSTMRADHRAWWIVVRAIAERMVVTATESATTIEEIQSLTLVPIEFALMSNPVGPRTTLRVVEQALERTAR
jgi:hypothetical protein